MGDDVQFAYDDVIIKPAMMFHRAVIKLQELGYYWNEENEEFSTDDVDDR